MGDVVVVASVNVDLVLTADRLPEPGETVTGGEFSRHFGGKGANQAVAAARWGANVHVLAAVGDDDHGEDSIRALADEGIDTRHVGIHQESPTGVALITVDREGNNQIAVASGANLLVDAADLEDLVAGMQDPGVLLTGFEIPEAAVVRTLEVAATYGWTVVVDPAPARDADIFRGSDAVLTPNRGELATLAGDGSPEEAARRLAEEVTGGPVVVTLGADGCLIVEPDGTASTIAPPAVTPRDTTGAGDTFAGVLAAGLAAGRPVVEAAEAAVSASALSTEAAGARTGMPTRDRVHARRKR